MFSRKTAVVLFALVFVTLTLKSAWPCSPANPYIVYPAYNDTAVPANAVIRIYTYADDDDDLKVYDAGGKAVPLVELEREDVIGGFGGKMILFKTKSDMVPGGKYKFVFAGNNGERNVIAGEPQSLSLPAFSDDPVVNVEHFKDKETIEYHEDICGFPIKKRITELDSRQKKKLAETPDDFKYFPEHYRLDITYKMKTDSLDPSSRVYLVSKLDPFQGKLLSRGSEEGASLDKIYASEVKGTTRRYLIIPKDLGGNVGKDGVLMTVDFRSDPPVVVSKSMSVPESLVPSFNSGGTGGGSGTGGITPAEARGCSLVR